jgi:glycerophosphoryl diester phosphodiesterase
MPTSFLKGPKPRVFGHRGAAGLAPENTLPSFALALALGADVLEFDVHATRDGIPVVLHDAALDRTTDASGPVSELTWSQLLEVDAGFRFSRDGRDFPYRRQGIRVPKLEAVLKAFPLARCNLEIKQDSPEVVSDVANLIRRLGAEHRVMLAAEHDSIMQMIRAVAEGVATSFSTGEVADFISRVQQGNFDGYTPAGCALQIPSRFGEIELVTAESVAAAHRLGLEVHVWTVNDADEMRALLDLEVDGIMSDLPGIARLVVDSRK